MDKEIPTPEVERIPRTADGSTWYAFAVTSTGQTIGASARTYKAVMAQFSEQWAMFGN